MTKESMDLSPATAWGVVGEAAYCSDHPCEVPFTEADIEKVFYTEFTGDRGNYDDTSSCAIFRLKDGRHVVAEEWSDSTGHGCQCSGAVDVFPNKEDLIQFGFDDAERETLAKYVHDSSGSETRK
jgi:hypothetical protein